MPDQIIPEDIQKESAQNQSEQQSTASRVPTPPAQSTRPAAQRISPSETAQVGIHHNLLYIAIVAVFAIMAIGALYLYTSSNPSVHAKTSMTTYSTTIAATAAPTNASNAITATNAFLSAYNASALTQVTLYQNSPFNKGGACTGLLSLKWFSQPEVNVTSSASASNFSKLDQSIPFAQYVAVYTPDASNASEFSLEVNQTGLCPESSLYSVFSNSTYHYGTFGYKGMLLHEYLLSNFTNEGLNLTSNNYVGKKPDLYWYFVTGMYGGQELQFGSWGPIGSINDTALRSQAEQFLNAFMSNVTA